MKILKVDNIVILRSDLRKCPLLTNITIDASTFAVLDALPNAGDADKDDIYRGFAVDKDISTDAAACSDAKGTIQKLWKSTSKFIVNVCVLSSAPTTTSPPEPPSSSKPKPMRLYLLSISLS